MSESRKDEMEALKERIGRGDYAIDPQQVADAIVRRLSSERQCS